MRKVFFSGVIVLICGFSMIVYMLSNMRSGVTVVSYNNTIENNCVLNVDWTNKLGETNHEAINLNKVNNIYQKNKDIYMHFYDGNHTSRFFDDVNLANHYYNDLRDGLNKCVKSKNN